MPVVQYMEPQDHGWMYGHSFADLDGHQWKLCIWMKMQFHYNNFQYVTINNIL
jgi:predicted lactoylglutathione lyase